MKSKPKEHLTIEAFGKSKKEKMKLVERSLEMANQEIKEWQKFKDICLRRLKSLKNKEDN